MFEGNKNLKDLKKKTRTNTFATNANVRKLDPNLFISIQDVDECFMKLRNVNKNATCINTKGSFYCFCNHGLTGNGTYCNDINECLQNDSCHKNATCTNTFGGYGCTCNKGFIGKGEICTDKDECLDNSHQCDDFATCTNTYGSYKCVCNMVQVFYAGMKMNVLMKRMNVI